MIRYTVGILMLTILICTTGWTAAITIDGNFDDWSGIPVLINDPDDVAEDNGDIKAIKVTASSDTLYAMIQVYGEAAPVDNQRYYYHILIDADNNIDTGFNNSEYEGNPTGVQNPIGADYYIQIGRKNGADDGIAVYFLDAGEQVIGEGFDWKQGGDSLELAVPFDMFNTPGFDNLFVDGQTMKIAAFQEGSANDWECDWTESAEYEIGNTFPVEAKGKLAVRWAEIRSLP